MLAAKRILVALGGVGLSLLLACGAAKDSFGDPGWSEDQHHRVAGRDATSLFQSEVAEVDRSQFVLRGVRHDLAVSATATLTARCRCLDVVVGAAMEPRFRWAGERPSVAPDDAIVAIRTEGSQCPRDVRADRRPSIQAVDLVEGHVIVTVEELPTDRPQALGAVIPSPAEGSAIYVRSAKRKKALPYARSKAKHGMCRVFTRSNASAKKSSK